MRTISSYGEDKLVEWEGEVLHTYDDFDPKHLPIKTGQPIRGTLTIGVGHTGPDVTAGLRITQARSRQLLRSDIRAAEIAVERSVLQPLNDYQFAALVSFAFNVGVGAFKGSTLLKRLNAGDYDAVPGELMKWTKSKGKTLPGLVTRRGNEVAMWNKGERATVTADVTPATDNPWTKPETLIPAAGGVGTVVTTVATSGMDPIRLAIAVSIVAITALTIFFVYKRIKAA